MVSFAAVVGSVWVLMQHYGERIIGICYVLIFIMQLVMLSLVDVKVVCKLLYLARSLYEKLSRSIILTHTTVDCMC